MYVRDYHAFSLADFDADFEHFLDLEKVLDTLPDLKKLSGK